MEAGSRQILPAGRQGFAASPGMGRGRPQSGSGQAAGAGTAGPAPERPTNMKDLEREHILATLREFGGSRKKTVEKSASPSAPCATSCSNTARRATTCETWRPVGATRVAIPAPQPCPAAHRPPDCTTPARDLRRSTASQPSSEGACGTDASRERGDASRDRARWNQCRRRRDLRRSHETATTARPRRLWHAICFATLTSPTTLKPGITLWTPVESTRC